MAGTGNEIDDPRRTEIWKGDLLGRKSEADLIQAHVGSEAALRLLRGRKQSYVLAIDAAYGEGKTWFLERLKQQLQLYHPVAFVDAWADETGDEPLTALMCAIEDALKPYLSDGPLLKERLSSVTRAALPAMGKIITRGMGKAAQRYFGDEIENELSEIIDDNSNLDQHLSEGFKESTESLTAEVSQLFDRRGATLLAEFKKKKSSREEFQKRMARLVEAVDGDNDQISSPFFIIVDELDRCRPDYAISVLEETKHFFDVAGVAFIIALHGDQLEKSVSAVYGEQFDSKSYLQRFFSHRYGLRRLEMSEFAKAHFSQWADRGTKFAAPKPEKVGWKDGEEFSPVVCAGMMLNELGANPREAQSILDMIETFHRNWEVPQKICLPYLLALCLSYKRNVIFSDLIEQTSPSFTYGFRRHDGDYGVVDGKAMLLGFHKQKDIPFRQVNTEHHHSPHVMPAINWITEEMRSYGARVPVYSALHDYPARVALLGNFEKF